MKRYSLKLALPYLGVFLSYLGTIQPTTAAAWEDYFGSHYRKMEWASSVRDPEGAGTFAVPYQGRQLTTLREFTANHDVVYGIGGLGSGRNQQAVDFFLTRMLLDFGQSWKDELKTNAKKIWDDSDIDQSRVYWQFGNEINSRRFSETVFSWDGNKKRPQAHSAETIPYYVEYFLAPGVEALLEARADLDASERHMPSPRIVLGSIAAYANPKSQEFLEQLLNYTISGLCAPELKGKKVYEIIDVVSLHYIASANSGDWEAVLDNLRTRWLGKASIKAIWSTEELGIRRAKEDLGAVFSSLVFSRYMNWWLNNDLQPAQGRAFLWGSDVGPDGGRGIDAMNYIRETLGGAAQLEVVPAKDYILVGDNLESYVFTTKNGNNKLLFIFPRNQRDKAYVKKMDLLQLGEVVGSRSYSRNGSLNLAGKIDGRRISETVYLPPNSAWILTINQ